MIPFFRHVNNITSSRTRQTKIIDIAMPAITPVDNMGTFSAKKSKLTKLLL